MKKLWLFAIVALVAAIVFPACSSSASADLTAQKIAAVETDLCKLRAFAKAAEVAIPGAEPTPGSVREKIDAAEDALCALRPVAVVAAVVKPGDAGTP